jgi:type IV pilus assembly protein PilZ
MVVQHDSEILSLVISDQDELHRSYMPLIIDGGLFIATQETFALNHEFFFLLRLLNDSERISFTGKVIWITPSNSENYREQGVGIQFCNDSNGIIKKKIEKYLSGYLNCERATYTM